MEQTRLLKVVWMLTTLVIIPGKGQHDQSEPPDIVMYYDMDRSQVTCVAGTNTYGNGLALVASNRTHPFKPEAFEYKDKNGLKIQEIGCDYETDSACAKTEIWVPYFTSRMSSGRHPFAPVIDDRWNKFPTEYTTGAYPIIKREISERNFHISFSVRSYSDAQVLLCNLESGTPKDSPCYWILIDAFDYKDITALRKCEKGVPDDYPRGKNNACRTRLKENEIKLLHEMEWVHFIITRENGNHLKLWESRTDTPIFEYMDQNPLEINSLHIRGYGTKAEWKIHNYQYVAITEKDRDISLGSPINFQTSDTLCISLYVALCSRCSLVIMIQSERGSNGNKIVMGRQEQFISWQLVKLEVQAYPNIQYSLYVRAIADNDVADTFWAIDDIRRCYNDEIKVSTTWVSKTYLKSTTCQSLQYPQWTVKGNSANTKPEVFTECANPQFTGTFCNISCSSILSTTYCQRTKICLPTILDEDVQCNCAPGYRGTNCQTECSDGYFGYSCLNKCGNCKGGKSFCNKFTGECANDCEEGYDPPLCIDTLGPVLVVPPTIIAITHTTVTVQLNNITATGTKQADTFQIEYKETESNSLWQQYGQRETFSLYRQVIITGLAPETKYYIRAVLYTADGKSYRFENLPYINVTTTCEVNRRITIESSARSVNISLLNNGEGCSIKNYNIKLKQTNISSYLNKDWIQIDNLQAFKTYDIIIINYLYPSYIHSESFTTQEDAPGPVHNLRSVNIADTSISIAWDIPFEQNGRIREYILSRKLQQYIGCKPNINDDLSPITVMPDKISDVHLPNLHPYTTYEITVIAVTTANGTAISKTFNTLPSNDVSDLELPSKVTVVSFSTSATIQWTPPECENRMGPLTYRITVRCVHDMWCDHVEPETIEMDGSFTSVDTQYKSVTFTPFTNYMLELRAIRNSAITAQSISVPFKTWAGGAPKVRNLTVYSRGDTFVSLRWRDPYPPHGTVDHYEIRHCYIYGRCSWTNYFPVKPVLCTLWDDYWCLTLTQLYKAYVYKFSVRAINKGVSYSDSENTVETTTEEGMSSAPLNFNSTWDNNKLILHWNYPDVPDGTLRLFLITVQQIDTEITGREIAGRGQDQLYEYKLPIDHLHLQKNYNYTIDKTIPYSSSYKISICGVNKYDGTSATIDVNTPPETPELDTDTVIAGEGITNTTIPIIVPGVKANTKSRTSYMYILVNEKKTTNVVKRDADDKQSNIKEEILQFAHNAWIAAELQSSESNVTFIVGNNLVTYSEQLNEDLLNKPLIPSQTYDITIVVMNVYKNRRSYKDYKSLASVSTTETPVSQSSGALYALLLLLILPVIVYVILRYRLKKNNGQGSHSMITLPRLNITRTETQTDPDVIPLTEPSKDIAHEKKNDRKKPAIMPKPGQNSKLPEEPPKEATVSNNATNFFHSRLVPLNNLENYIKEALASGELEEQHALFPRGQTKPWDYGILKQNKFKNRYNNLIAYDQNRVKLQKIGADQFSDYVNASYIHGYKQDKAYIATQGPKPTTVNDFWRMIWQQKVQYIVMLANVVEGGKKKCEKYWPDIEQSQTYGEIEVLFIKSELYADFEYRSLEITKNGQTRNVLQMHFTSWPDHGVPIYPQSLVPFLKKLLALPQSTAPIVVHCRGHIICFSAGVGRTGTIILCDICLRMAAREGAVDILRYLHEIREQRANMVDNSDQYKLVHMVLLECLISPDSNIPCNKDLSAAIQKLVEEGGLQIQLNFLQQSSWKDQALNFASTKELDPANKPKNRFTDIIPLENRIYISRYPTNDEHSDYINAVPVDGFRFKEQFIVTQTPLPNTVLDFWRMIVEKEVKVIVSLNGIPVDDETCCIYWPSEQEEITSVPNVCIKYHKYQTYDNYDVHTLLLEKEIDQGKVKSLLHVVQFKGWNHEDKLPPSVEQLVMLWEESEKLSRGNYPMVVTCYNGATACGLFVAMSFVIEKVKLEQHCDPSLAVRVIRRNRKQFIADKTQFEFLYKSAVVYLSLFETYSNFEPVANK